MCTAVSIYLCFCSYLCLCLTNFGCPYTSIFHWIYRPFFILLSLPLSLYHRLCLWPYLSVSFISSVTIFLSDLCVYFCLSVFISFSWSSYRYLSGSEILPLSKHGCANLAKPMPLSLRLRLYIFVHISLSPCLSLWPSLLVTISD